MRRIFFGIFLLVALATRCRAQVATGLYTYGSFDTQGFDTIDRGSLNVHFSIPIVSKSGRGLPFVYSLVYDGLIWSPSSVQGNSAWTPDSSFGLHGNLLNEGYKGYLSYRSSSPVCGFQTLPSGERVPKYGTSFSNYIYFDNFGAAHGFSYFYDSCTNPTTSGSTQASDGSGYQLNGTSITTAQGTTLTVPVQVNGGSNTLTATITDLNGNQVTNNQTGSFTDTTGANILNITGSGTASSPKTFTYLTNGGSASVTVNYSSYAVKTNFGCSGVTEYNQTANLASSLTLPDSTSYKFSYEATPGSSGYTTGRLASITLPGGGVISYTYPNGVNCPDGTPTTLTRTTSDGTRTYTRSNIASVSSATDIADAGGNHSEWTFVKYGSPADFYETSESWYSGGASGTPLLAKNTCYNNASSPCTTSTPSAAVNEIDTYQSMNGMTMNGQTLQFNSNGLLTRKIDYDFGSSTSRGPALEQEVWAYPTSGIASLVSSDTVYDGSNNQVSQLTYAYDQNSVTATSSLPQHAGAIGSQRGNLTTVTQWLNTSNSNITVASNTYYDTGQIQSSAGLNGTTSYGYDSTGSFLTTTTLPTPNTGVAMSTAAQYDTNSGVLLSSTDISGHTTSYGNYDSFDRVRLVADPAGGQDYYGFNATWMGHDHNIDGSNARMSTGTYYDGYGRYSNTQTANGQSQSYRTDNCYDSSGRPNFVSLPYFNGGGANVCSGSGDATAYDALGRVISLTHIDGTRISYSYNGRATQVVDEYGVTRIQQTDGLGRLIGVCEVSSSTSMPGSGSPQACGFDIAGTGFSTTYTYNLAGHNTTTNTGGQVRSFTTDSWGRLVSAQEPEMFTGAASTLTTYSYSYGNGELQVTRTKPLQNQTNTAATTTQVATYDALGRLRYLHYTDNGVTPDAEYLYDTAQWAEASQQTNLKGHLSLANTGNAGSLFSYDAAGRVITMWECQPSGCGAAAKDRVLNFSYDYAGRQLTQTDAYAGTVNFAYSPASEITGITNSTYNNVQNPGTYVGSVVNSPSGPTLFSQGNGLNQVMFYWGTGQIQGKWLCSGSTSTYCTNGTQLYGNLATWKGPYMINAIDTVMNTGGPYTYDGFGRLQSFASNAGQSSSFSWTYDRWGNRWSQTPGASLSFSQGMNRVNSASYQYDAAGNMIHDAVHSYTYDQNGNVLTVDGGSTASYIYDAMNQRVQVKVPSATNSLVEYTYDFNGKRITTWNANANQPLQAQVWWGSLPIAYRGADGTTYFEQSDYMGTQRRVTNYAGAVTGTYLSNPFGDGYSASGQDDNRTHYGLTEHDSETATEHAQFRQYATNAGMWMSLDPYRGSYDLTNPQSLNRYAYALNNPMSFIDPLGLVEEACKAGTAAGTICMGVNGNTGDDGGDSPNTGGGGGGAGAGGAGGGGGRTGVFKGIVLPIVPFTDPCQQKASDIHALRNEILNRFQAYSDNALPLPLFGPMSRAGHIQQIGNKQTALQNALNDYRSSGCGGPSGNAGLPSDVNQVAFTSLPELSPSGSTKRLILTGGTIIVGGAALILFAPEALIFAPALAF